MRLVPPIDMIHQYHHTFKRSTLLRVRRFPENILHELYLICVTDCWEIISEHEILSETFIHEFAPKLDWVLIFIYQTCSQKFPSDPSNYFKEAYQDSSSENERGL